MAANWPTHRARRPLRVARRRWEAKTRRRERAGVVPQKAKTRPEKDTAPIPDWVWDQVGRTVRR